MKTKLFSIALVFVMLLTACGTELYTEGNDEGYTLVKDVDGVSFGVVSSVVRNATAITSISETMSFERDQTYLYKNGESDYLMFNISSLVLAVQKGTSFNLAQAEDKTEAVTSNNVMGIWFDLPKDKLDYSDNTADGTYKFMATVNGEVSVTSELYGDFAGKLVIINDGTEEWSLFVGSRGDDFSDFSDEMKDALNYMAASLQKADTAEVEKQSAVDIGGDEQVDTSESTEEVIVDVPSEEITDADDEKTENATETAEEDISLDEPADVTDKEESEDQEDEVEIVEEEEPSEPETDDSSEEEVPEENEDSDDADKPEEEAEEPAEAPEEDIVEEEVEKEQEVGEEEEAEVEVESESALDKRGLPIVLNNQKETQKDDTTIYESSIYDMLRLSKWGYLDVKNKRDIETISAKISELKTGEEAVLLIKDAISSANVPYEYFSARPGTSWHVVKVTEGEGNASNHYIDVRIVGVDGNKLNYRGIKYSSRTYNITISDKEKYVYYEVPNGCAEYVLECGDGSGENSKFKNSYYLMQKGTDYE